jgi:hypothetical protein
MTIAEMRDLLNMPEGEFTDEQVVAAYAEFLDGEEGEAPSPMLVTLEAAKQHLRILDNDHDADITLKLEGASRIVIDYVDRADLVWTAETVPASAKVAVLLVLGALFEDREGGEPLSRAVVSLLAPYRRTALA